MTQLPTWNGRTAPGTTIGGRYTVRAVVGHGGMGTVWQATDTVLNRDVAVKEVVPPLEMAQSDRDAMYERTMREARAAACLSHPSVVQVYDVVTEHGRPWIVMELLEARSLADLVVEDGPLAPRAVAKIGLSLLGALEVAHAAGILHRDVKPANVLIARDGRCVLTDFGVAHIPAAAQLTTPGMVLGSPHFISPERAIGHAFGPPSDLFSLGVTLYTAVEGRPPFDRGDPIETMHAVVEDAPAPLLRAGALAEVLMGLLEKDPYRRWDVQNARTTLRELLAGALASTAPPYAATDPYAVVPAQRVTALPKLTAAAQPKPSGEIGGRAMLAPGESLAARLNRAAAPDVDGTASGIRPRQLESTAAHAVLAEGRRPDHGYPTDGPQRTDPGYRGREDLGHRGADDLRRGGEYRTGQRPDGRSDGGHDRTAPLPRHTSPADAAPATGLPATPWGQHDPAATIGLPAITAAGRPVIPPQAPQRPMATQPIITPRNAPHRAAASAPPGFVDALRELPEQVRSTVMGWPRQTQLAALGGVAAVLLIGVVIAAVGGDDPIPAASITTPHAAAKPDFPVRKYAEHGVTVNIPAGWERASAGNWVDFLDPKQDGRKVRILVEPASSKPMRFMEIAENGLRKARTCADPYEQVALRPVTLAGEPAAELEYTCGSGATKRHGVWRAVTSGGHAYSFYLTAQDGQFDASRSIFDEMVRSFRLTQA